MIKPDELSGTDASALDLSDMAALERAADKAITGAHKSGVWPARVGKMRMVIGHAEVDAVAASYAAAKWIVTKRPNTGTYFFIDRPRPAPVVTPAWVGPNVVVSDNSPKEKP